MTASPATPPKVRFGQTSGGADATPGFGPAGALAGVALILVVLGGLLWSARSSPAESAQHPRLFGGSLVLEDQRQLTVIDVTTGAVVAGLQSVNTQVGAPAAGDVQAVPVNSGTMLIDRRTGTFNELGQDNYMVDAAGPGVGLGPVRDLTSASGLAAGSGAYIVRYAPRSTVSLVDESTVAAAAKVEGTGGIGSGPGRLRPERVWPERLWGGSGTRGSGTRGSGARPAQAVTPRGFAALSGPVSTHPGSAAVAGPDLWALVGTASSCQVTQLRPVATGRGLTATPRATLPTTCEQAAVEAIPAAVGVASPGRVRLFLADSHHRPGRQIDVSVPGTRSDTEMLPVGASTGTLWYLAGGAPGAGGWSVFGVSPTGEVTGPSRLSRFGPNAAPAPPVESEGTLYTLDRASKGQPTLWTVVPATGAMTPVPGSVTYPARTTAEKASFTGAEVLADGPRVVFNNPGSLLAVVVFTDGSHPPVVVDKSSAIAISPVGPTVAGPPATSPRGRGPTSSNAHPAAPAAAPVVQPVNPAVTCATTTQKPYAPQITSVQPSSESALVTWSYQLLDQGDCEPDSWAVRVTALNSSHQPGQPVQIVNGQDQLQLAGLRPSTTYQVTVTAYINTQSTASTPATFITTARGPDAPTAVRTAADGQGDWIVSWTPCPAATCVVPASTWNVVGTACSSSFVGQPPAVQVPAGQNTITVNASTLGLLGDSLSFSVQGVLATGLTGNPTSDHTCTAAWHPPDAAAIHLADRGTPGPTGQSITATLQVSTSGPAAVDAYGSNSTEFVYSVGGVTIGPTPSTQVSVPGLAGGTHYTPTVRVYPAGHPSAVAVIAGPPFSRNLQWPAGLTVAVTPVVSPANPNLGSLLIGFRNLPPGPMTAAGSIQCGSTQIPVGGMLTNGSLSVPNIDLVDFGGTCTLAMTVTDTAAPNPYGLPWPSPTTGFTIGAQPAYAFSDQISAPCQQHFCPPGQQQIQVNFAGPGPQPTAGGDWTITAGDGAGDCAATVALATPAFPVTIDNWPRGCRDVSGVDISVNYMYLGQTIAVPLGPPTGTPGTTTTTAPTTSTTSTTSTTRPPSTTSSTSTTSPSSSTTSTSTTAAAAAAVQPAQDARLVAARGSLGAADPTPARAGDAQVRAALEWGLLLAGAAGAWWARSVWRAARRNPRGRPRS